MNKKGKRMIIDMLNPDGTVRCSKCYLKCSRYAENGNIAIEALCTDKSVVTSEPEVPSVDGEPWAVLTVNPSVKYDDYFICVKDYSENAGVRLSLERAGLIKKQEYTVIHRGWVEIPVCELTAKGLKFVKSQLATAQEKLRRGYARG